MIAPLSHKAISLDDDRLARLRRTAHTIEVQKYRRFHATEAHEFPFHPKPTLLSAALEGVASACDVMIPDAINEHASPALVLAFVRDAIQNYGDAREHAGRRSQEEEKPGLSRSTKEKVAELQAALAGVLE